MSVPILINGVAPPAGIITGIEWKLSDLDGGEGTGRSEMTGEMFRDRIARCRGLTLSVGPTTVSEMSTLLQMIKYEFVALTYLDAFDGAWRTDEFYVADRGAPILEWDCDLEPGATTDFSGVTWGSCSMDFVGRGNPIGEEVAGEEVETDA